MGKRIVFAGIWFISLLWGITWAIRDIRLIDVWWGFPFFMTAAFLIMAGVWAILLWEHK